MKKLLLLILSTILIINQFSAAYAAENCSVWAKSYIEYAESTDLIPNELYGKYTQDITRLDFAHLAVNIIAHIYNTSSDELIGGYSSEKSPFSDTDSIYVSAAADMGLISGTDDGRFLPDNTITRQEAAKILAGVYSLCTNDIGPFADCTSKYDDSNDISDWARPYINTVSSLSVMTGTSDTLFAPLSTYTAEQAVVTFMRLYEVIAGITAANPDKNNKNPEISSALYVKDGRLTDGSSEVVLNGVNLGGWLIMEEWMGPVAYYQNSAYSDILSAFVSRFGEYRAESLIKSYEDNFITEADFETIEALGFNCVRIPFWYRSFIDENGKVKSDSDGFMRLDFALEQCRKHGIYAILDMHGCPGGQSMNHSTGVTAKNELYTNEKNLKIMETIWSAIASRYKDNPCIAAYDIMNEPQNNGDYIGAYAWKAESTEAVAHTNSVYDRMIKAIRKIDEKHIISVEGIWTLDVLPSPDEYNWTNMMYQLHIYDTSTDMIDKRVNELISARDSYDVAVLAGEYNSKGLERYAAEKYSANDISRIKWTYKTFNVSYDNWGLFNKEYTKINLRTATYDEIKSAFENDIKTENGFVFNATEYSFIKK